MPASPLSVIRFRVVFSIWWLVLLADHAFVLYLLDLPLTITLIDSCISNGVLLLLCLLIINTLRYLPQRNQYSNLLIGTILLTTGGFLLVRWLLSLCLGAIPFYETWLLRSMPVRASLAFLIIGCLTMVSVLWYNQEEQEFVPLHEEINNLQLYLDIEKVRFGHRLQTSVITEENAKLTHS